MPRPAALLLFALVPLMPSVLPGLGLQPSFAQAQLSIPLYAGEESQVRTLRYSCGGAEPFTVQYITTPSNALALIDVAGETRVFVNVISASGARYVSGSHEFWSKGATATFKDEMAEGPAADCVEVK